jgi:phenylacetate-CoA ligase
MHWLRRKVAPEVRKKLEFLLESQYWGESRIREYQWDKLQKIIRHSYEHVPYYRNAFEKLGLVPEDISSFEAYAQLPVLTKAEIQDRFDDLVADNVDRSALALNSTGGSTGVPLNFYQDDNYVQWADAARLRAWRYMAGVGEKELEAVLWGAVRDIGTGITFKQLLYNFVREGTLTLNTFDLDVPKLTEYLKYFNLLKPSIVRGYASSLYYVACHIEKEGVRIHKPKAVISSTEVLHARMRETIERVFGAKVFDSYGCRELSQIATECEAHNGMHLVFENQYVEVSGEDILLTNLNNFAMPFLRYKVGDLASSIDASPCSCGRHAPRIVNLLGRDNDNIELADGKVINGEFFEFLFFGIASVIQYQVVYRRSADRLQVKLHLRDDSVDAGGIVKEIMREKFNYDKVDIVYSDTFDKTPTGKLRFVYCAE